jgi:hypothetical protein
MKEKAGPQLRSLGAHHTQLIANTLAKTAFVTIPGTWSRRIEADSHSDTNTNFSHKNLTPILEAEEGRQATAKLTPPPVAAAAVRLADPAEP